MMNDELNYSYFKCRVNMFKYEGSVNKGNHRYTVFEDVVGFFCSKYEIKDGGKIDLIVMKLNRLEPQENKLTTNSFKRKISNMDNSITHGVKGLARSSSQGDNIAMDILKLQRFNGLTKQKLREFIREYYGEEIV